MATDNPQTDEFTVSLRYLTRETEGVSQTQTSLSDKLVVNFVRILQQLVNTAGDQHNSHVYCE